MVITGHLSAVTGPQISSGLPPGVVLIHRLVIIPIDVGLNSGSNCKQDMMYHIPALNINLLLKGAYVETQIFSNVPHILHSLLWHVGLAPSAPLA